MPEFNPSSDDIKSYFEWFENFVTPTKADCECIAEGFNSRWQFPNSLGAVERKHVAIVSSPKSGSKFFNYKGTFFIVLMAVVDSDCKYVLVDVGAEGRKRWGNFQGIILWS
ncbi:hypothetical protein MRX96_000901 [Rhipicephalus microplus]